MSDFFDVNLFCYEESETDNVDYQTTETYSSHNIAQYNMMILRRMLTNYEMSCR